ncbi:MAG: hypothetical protein CMP33_00450 [Rickettsiales bacterium]|nr:hypothetical protein [Rickettsiales bacterium]|tara:strand:- start:26063 stop:26434 length:372 start_codon:yes stop_codon:yes gene_type:complete
MLRKDIEEKFPFISVVTYGQKEFVGIINNQDNFVTSMYVYTDLMEDQEKKAFMELGEAWWWESNRMIPISIFMRKEMEQFRNILTTMNSKDVKVVMGPTVNLNNLSVKRVKRKSVQLIRKPKP